MPKCFSFNKKSLYNFKKYRDQNVPQVMKFFMQDIEYSIYQYGAIYIQ
jgi:hypothetical protein